MLDHLKTFLPTNNSASSSPSFPNRRRVYAARLLQAAGLGAALMVSAPALNGCVATGTLVFNDDDTAQDDDTFDPSDKDQDGFTPGQGDCDDSDPAINPDADEVCDNVDNNCDGNIDEDGAVDGDQYWPDRDHDTFGDSESSVTLACNVPDWGSVDAVQKGNDCDDENEDINPDADEIWYDGVDQNCDGANDYDQDGDGEESEAEGTGPDCDDTDASINTATTEVWYDGVDQDCNGANDYDQDGDSYESDSYGGTDCDDTDATSYPGGTEVSDGADNDCDGLADNILFEMGYDSNGDGVDNQTVVQAEISSGCTVGIVTQNGAMCMGESATPQDVCDDLGLNSAKRARGYWWGDCGGPDVCDSADISAGSVTCSGYTYDCNGIAFDSGLYYWDPTGDYITSSDTETYVLSYDDYVDGGEPDPGYDLIVRCNN